MCVSVFVIWYRHIPKALFWLCAEFAVSDQGDVCLSWASTDNMLCAQYNVKDFTIKNHVKRADLGWHCCFFLSKPHFRGWRRKTYSALLDSLWSWLDRCEFSATARYLTYINWINKRNRTESFWNVLLYLRSYALFEPWRDAEFLGVSLGSKLCTTHLNITWWNNDKISNDRNCTGIAP